MLWLLNIFSTARLCTLHQIKYKQKVEIHLKISWMQIVKKLDCTMCKYHQYYSLFAFSGCTSSCQQPEHSGFSIQGWQQLSMGILFMHWATIGVNVEQLHCTLSLRGCWAIRNTPGFMLEHFIVLFLAGTKWTPSSEGWRLRVMTIGNGIHPKPTR